jgi:hypothetical protein
MQFLYFPSRYYTITKKFKIFSSESVEHFFKKKQLVQMLLIREISDQKWFEDLINQF